MKGIRKTKITEQYCDADYLDKLTAADAEWLSQFNREYYCHPSQSQIAIHPKEQGTELRQHHAEMSRDVLTQSFSSELFDDHCSASLNPEDACILKEEIGHRIRKKVKSKANKI